MFVLSVDFNALVTASGMHVNLVEATIGVALDANRETIVIGYNDFMGLLNASPTPEALLSLVHNTAFSAGFDVGHNEGYEKGIVNSDAFSAGFDAGHNEGYEKGIVNSEET